MSKPAQPRDPSAASSPRAGETGSDPRTWRVAPQPFLTAPSPAARRPSRRRWWPGALSFVVHAGLIGTFLFAAPKAVEEAADPPMVVQLITLPPPLPPPPPAPVEAPPEPAPPAPVKPPPTRKMSRPPKAPVTVAPVFAKPGPPTPGVSELSDAEIASAATAGSGSGGGGGSCDMLHRLEVALRKDPDVVAAVRAAGPGKALMVWNGDWVRHTSQDGAGLASVREAILWEVAFAPEACRTQPVRGLVLISLNDGPGAARLALGKGGWRWSDMLYAAGAARR